MRASAGKMPAGLSCRLRGACDRLSTSMSSLTLTGRIGLLALGAMLVGLGLFSWLGVQSVNESIAKTLDERLTMARTVASYLDGTVSHVLVQLESAARFNDGGPVVPEEFQPAAAAFRDILGKSGIHVRNVFLIDRSGKVQQVVPQAPGPAGMDMPVYREVRETLATGSSGLSGLVPDPLAGAPVLLATAAVFDSEGEVAYGMTGSIDIEQSRAGAFSQTIIVGRTGYTEIVDGNGVVLARTRPGSPPRAFEQSDHPSRFAELISQGEATVGTCHRCHGLEGVGQREKDVLAFAPVSTTSWGVAIRQSEDEALSPARQLQERFLISGAVLLACTLLLVWAVIRAIVKPIRMLTFAARKVALNDFDAAVPLERRDEIGQLSAAFQDMRQEIARSRDRMMLLYEEAKHREEEKAQLLERVIGAQEEERKRIARELHDEYGQTLTALIMSIESLEGTVAPAQSRFKDKLSNTKSLLVRTLENLRRLTLDLRPSALDDLGLVVAVNTYLRTHLGDAGIQVQFTHSGVGRGLTPPVATTLFRIVQEAVHNVVKHAQARNVRVEILAGNNSIVASVEDDGRGFDVDAVLKSGVGSRSLGLLGIRERVTLLGGAFTIRSEAGRGTRLEVEIPVDGLSPDRPQPVPGGSRGRRPAL